MIRDVDAARHHFVSVLSPCEVQASLVRIPDHHFASRTQEVSDDDRADVSATKDEKLDQLSDLSLVPQNPALALSGVQASRASFLETLKDWANCIETNNKKK
jgi:hypothetical protein